MLLLADLENKESCFYNQEKGLSMAVSVRFQKMHLNLNCKGIIVLMRSG